MIHKPRAQVTHTERRKAVEVTEVGEDYVRPVIVDIIEDWIGESPDGFERRRRWFVDLMRLPALMWFLANAFR